jgi:hypothetical protein
MGDPSSTIVFSIDPGIVNVGVCCYDYGTGEVLFADKLTLAPSLKALTNDAEITVRVFKLFFDDKNSPYKKMINSSKMVLIENQMKARMKIIQHVIGAFCFAGNIDYKMVAPQSIKAHFNTGSYARKKAGTEVKGKKNNHRENKKMGIAMAEKLHPQLFSKCSQAKKDDIADALLQAIWYGDKETGTKRKKVKDAPIMATGTKRKRTTKKKTTSSKKTKK